jgi:hypothetical protein
VRSVSSYFTNKEQQLKPPVAMISTICTELSAICLWPVINMMELRSVMSETKELDVKRLALLLFVYVIYILKSTCVVNATNTGNKFFRVRRKCRRPGECEITMKEFLVSCQ